MTTADDVTNKAAEVLIEHWRTRLSGCTCGRVSLGESYAEHVATVLADAGLLSTPAHDRAVAAKALRDARRYLVRVHPNGLTRKATVIADMDELIARIEAGESDE